jgi:hypothetical protein
MKFVIKFFIQKKKFEKKFFIQKKKLFSAIEYLFIYIYIYIYIMSIIYVIKLNDDKYYVGKTNDVATRMEAHKNGTGCAWTRQYKYKELIETISGADETVITVKYMSIYGIDNVRGGPFVTANISHHKPTIEAMINSMNDLCQNCQQSGHFIKNCPYIIPPRKNEPLYPEVPEIPGTKTSKLSSEVSSNDESLISVLTNSFMSWLSEKIEPQNSDISINYAAPNVNNSSHSSKSPSAAANVNNSSYSSKSSSTAANINNSSYSSKSPSSKNKSLCSQCGRNSHTAGDCYASTNIDGQIICIKCGRNSHTAKDCYASTNKNGETLCSKCGRNSHTAGDCYASTNIYGKRI